MSFWWYKRDKGGRHLLDFDPMVIMIIIAMLITLIRPPIFRNPSIIIPFIRVSVGLACLIIAKISLYK
jgi:hypothetical protein